ncbi:MAG: hypothetical protein HY901_38510, partial [Deltaproteobacteria bacterium]|nr:hypothetical protein [Deltaproteobacteria bacterium]
MPAPTAPPPSANPPAWPPPAPALTLSCPRCSQPAEPKPEAQRCCCGQRFLLRAGPLLDSTLAPPAADERTAKVVVRSSGLLLRRYAALGADG